MQTASTDTPTVSVTPTLDEKDAAARTSLLFQGGRLVVGGIVAKGVPTEFTGGTGTSMTGDGRHSGATAPGFRGTERRPWRSASTAVATLPGAVPGCPFTHQNPGRDGAVWLRKQATARPAGLVALALLVAVLSSGAAEARPARCFTTDDGHYACDFRATDKDGSFEISAKGKPTLMLNMNGPGRADGYADFGTGRNVNLPGTYLRSSTDGACWINDGTKTQICAR